MLRNHFVPLNFLNIEIIFQMETCVKTTIDNFKKFIISITELLVYI